MMTPLARLACATLLALSLVGPDRAHSAPAVGGAPPISQMIVKFQAGPAGETAAVAHLDAALGLAAGSLRPVRPMLNGAQVVALPQAVPIAEARQLAARLAAQPGVEYAFPNYIRRPSLIPTDPLFTTQWHLAEPAGGINAPAAWDLTVGITGVIVAVIDTGLLPHPDLPAERVLPGYDFVTDPFMANDEDPAGSLNSRDSDPADPGDWVTPNDLATQPVCAGQSPGDSSWHGTHVAGLIAAQGDNAQGVAGVAWGVRLLPVRALGRCGGADADIADAMLWAAGLASGDPNAPANPHPAQILNLSLGGASDCFATIYQPVVDQLAAAGVLVVAAAGNDGGAVNAPANCQGALAVAASNRAGDLSNFSSHGPEAALAAPGGQSLVDYIFSLFNTGQTTPAGACSAMRPAMTAK